MYPCLQGHQPRALKIELSPYPWVGGKMRKAAVQYVCEYENMYECIVRMCVCETICESVLIDVYVSVSMYVSL